MYKKLLLVVLMVLMANFSVQAEESWSGLGRGLAFGFFTGSCLAAGGLGMSLQQLHADKGEFNKATAIGTAVSLAALAYFGAFTFYAYKNSIDRNEKWLKLFPKK